MEKVQQKFKIGRKLITYEGYPSNRARDLMDIMSKLGVGEDIVVSTFRDNVAESEEYTDDQVLEMFHAAVKARAERKKTKDDSGSMASTGGGAGNTATTTSSNNNNNNHAQTLDTERPRRITLTYRGRQFSYEGLVSGKQRAVVQLLRKQRDVTPEIAIETFRANLPDCTLTDDAIWQLVSSSLQATKKETSTDTAAAGAGDAAQRNDNTDEAAQHQQQQQQQATSSAPRHARRDSDVNTSPSQQYEQASSNNQQQQQQQQQPQHTISAVGELANMTTKERDDLNNFIRQVLEQPPMDLATLLREEPRARSEDADESTGLALTARTSGKIVVYCQEDKSTASKIVHATPNMTYSEFASIIEKKYGRPMALSFYEGEDIVELDDDDGLAMFLEMCVQSGKKIKLICSDPNTRRKIVDDTLTEVRAGSNMAGSIALGSSATTTTSTSTSDGDATPQRVVPYSNGELQVKEVRTYTGHTLAVYCCAFSPRGDQFVTASRDRSVRLWNTRTGSCTVMKGGHNGFVLSCHFSPRGNRVVSSSDDRSIKVWNTTTHTKVATLKGHEDKVYCVRFNSTGEYIVSGSCDHTVRVWNAESFAKIVTLRGHTLAVFSCDFSNTNSGKYIVSGSDDRMIKLWDWESNREVRTLHGHTGTVWSVCFSHNDAHIVSASMDHELKLWSVATGACVRAMIGHTTPIHHALFSESDRYIFSCARDWSVMVWRVDTGERVETIIGHKSTVYHIELQGSKLLTSSLDDTLKLWDIGATNGL